FNTTTPILAVMIGLGVAIDYSLFVVTRFRQELAKGKSSRDAAAIAGSTAGRAVIFAGTTVAISISGLAPVAIPFVAKMGYGTARAVSPAVFPAVTLLPALLSKTGRHIDRWKVPFVKPRVTAAPNGAVAHVARLVERHPKSVLAGTLAVILTLAIPISALHI